MLLFQNWRRPSVRSDASDVLPFLHGRTRLEVCNEKTPPRCLLSQYGRGKRLRVGHYAEKPEIADSSVSLASFRSPRRREHCSPQLVVVRILVNLLANGSPARRSSSRASRELASCPRIRRTVRHQSLLTSCSGRTYIHADSSASGGNPPCSLGEDAYLCLSFSLSLSLSIFLQVMLCCVGVVLWCVVWWKYRSNN